MGAGTTGQIQTVVPSTLAVNSEGRFCVAAKRPEEKNLRRLNADCRSRPPQLTALVEHRS